MKDLPKSSEDSPPETATLAAGSWRRLCVVLLELSA